MKKTLQLVGVLLCAILLIEVSPERIFARITGTTVNPEKCWGDGGEEVCVDSSGNLISTTANAASQAPSS